MTNYIRHFSSCTGSTNPVASVILVPYCEWNRCAWGCHMLLKVLGWSQIMTV